LGLTRLVQKENNMFGDAFAVFTAVLLVFYLYLLVRPQYVRRGSFLWLGLAGLILVFLGMLFVTIDNDTWSRVLLAIFGFIGLTVALGAGAICCSGGDVPYVERKLHHEKTGEQAPPPTPPHASAGGETGANP
jgi:uncharacterized membrane protein